MIGFTNGGLFMWLVNTHVASRFFPRFNSVSSHFILGNESLYLLVPMADDVRNIGWQLVARSGNVNIIRTLGCADGDFYQFIGHLRFREVFNVPFADAFHVIVVLSYARNS